MADAQVAQFFIPKTAANKDVLITDAEYRIFLRQVNKHLGVLQSNKLVKAQIIADKNNKNFFHWFLEFPEVFSEGGFDCVLGNPPYLGGKKITTNIGLVYLEILKANFLNGGGVADLASYFVQRDLTIIKNSGFVSLITTNTISQGDSKLVGLGYLEKIGGSIIYAERSVVWPGQAAVTVTLISISKSHWSKEYWLDKSKVKNINSHLTEGSEEIMPFCITINNSKSFIGSYILGDGFILDKTEVEQIINENPNYEDVLYRYLNGFDLNGNIFQEPSRWVINFFNKPEEECKSKYLKCYEVLEERVKPERTRLDKSGNFVLRTPLPIRWWQYADKRPLLYKTTATLNRILVATRVSKNLIFTFVPNGYVYSDALVVFAYDDYLHFSLISSSIHEYWAWKFSSTMRSAGIRYTPTTAFETFPFPKNLDPQQEQQLETIGEAYHEHRRQLMLGMQLGLTKTYNLFHSKAITAQSVNDKDKQVAALQKHLEKIADPEKGGASGIYSFDEAIQGILKLRELHVQMDEAVLAAYGWGSSPSGEAGVRLSHDFYEVDYLPENDRVRFTIHPTARKEVLKRLLELNHKIHEEEVKAGLWDKKGGKVKAYLNEEVKMNIAAEPDSSYGGLFNQE